MTRSKKIAGLVAGIVAVSAVTGSFAYYSATHTVDNTLATLSYGDTLTEVFQPDVDWEPGEEVDKIVGVTNTGDYDIVVRVSMTETWTDADGNEIITVESTDGIAATASSGSALDNEVYYFDDTYFDFQPVDETTGDQYNIDDGLVEYDEEDEGSVVYKELDATDWTYSDGYWYYDYILASGDVTTSLLESITLCADTDMGTYTEVVYYYVGTEDSLEADDYDLAGDISWLLFSDVTDREDDDDEVVTWADVTVSEGEYLHIQSISSLTSTASGYAGATYVLTITSVTCQANEDAVTATYDNLATDGDIYTGWFPAE